MGRPLFSGGCRDARAPAVRVEPEPVYPTYEKWTHWNAFDPDSDEFFESDDAVYEAFVDPADLQPRPESREEGSRSSRSASPARITAGRAATDAVVLEDGSDISSGSSDGTASGRESPMEGASPEDARVEAGYEPLVVRVPVEPAAGGLTRTRVLYDRPEPAHTYRPGDDVSHFVNMYNIALRGRDMSATETALRSPAIDLPRTSDITPIFVRVPQDQPPRAPVLPTTPPRLFTPPPVHQTPPAFMTPSPPPTVTPRLYTWSSRPAPTPASPSPAPSDRALLTNPGARMSLAHIAPTAITARHIRI